MKTAPEEVQVCIHLHGTHIQRNDQVCNIQ